MKDRIIYTQTNPPKFRGIEYPEEEEIRDFVLEEGSLLPVVKVIDKRNWFKEIQAEAPLTDIERYKEIAKQKGQGSHQRVALDIMTNIVRTENNPVIPIDETNLSKDPLENYQKLKQLENQTKANLEKLPEDIRAEIEANAENSNYSINDLLSFIAAKYQEKEGENK